MNELQDLAQAAAAVVTNPKFAKAGPGPAWLWLCTLAYTQKTLLPGFIAEDALPHLGVRCARRMAEHLVAAGLWEPVVGGWQMIPLNAVLVRPNPQPRQDAAPSPPAGPIALRFPTSGVGPKEWPLTEAQIVEWQTKFPSLNVREECLAAHAWVLVKGKKTASGMSKFLVGWLTRSLNSRRSAQSSLRGPTLAARGRTGAPPAGKYDHH